MKDSNNAPADKQSQFYCVNNHRQPLVGTGSAGWPKLWQSYSAASYILSSLRKERLGEKGGAFLNGKEGRVGFRNK